MTTQLCFLRLVFLVEDKKQNTTNVFQKSDGSGN